MMRIISLIVLMAIFFQGFCQKKVDYEFIFKTHLFLEKANVANSNLFEVKDELLFQFFLYSTKLQLDTVYSTGFSEGYVFLRLVTKKNNNGNNAVTYNKNVSKTDSLWFVSIESDCEDYILCINKYSGKSFRLKGFNGSDFFNLFSDVNKKFEKLNQPKITIKSFLKDYGASSVDFRCIYKALKSGEYNKAKYPCLKGCEFENIIIH